MHESKMNFTEYETRERSNKIDSSNICKTELFAEYNIETMHHHITCCIKRTYINMHMYNKELFSEYIDFEGNKKEINFFC